MIKKENFELFPTLVTRYNTILNSEQINDIMTFCLEKNSNNHPSLIGSATSSHCATSNIVNDIAYYINSCKDLTLILESLFKEYVNDCGLATTTITNSWFNVQNSSSTLKQHTHPGSILSGALYISVDEQSSGIYFDNPNNNVQYLTANIHNVTSKYTNEYVQFRPNPGDFFVFPSWLYHGAGYEQNMTENRLVISLNTAYE
jgi:uncharacterized protein (TIGR02466 family)